MRIGNVESGERVIAVVDIGALYEIIGKASKSLCTCEDSTSTLGAAVQPARVANAQATRVITTAARNHGARFAFKRFIDIIPPTT